MLWIAKQYVLAQSSKFMRNCTTSKITCKVMLVVVLDPVRLCIIVGRIALVGVILNKIALLQPNLGNWLQ